MSGSGIHSSEEEITLTERTYSRDCLEDNAAGPRQQLDLVQDNFKVAN